MGITVMTHDGSLLTLDVTDALVEALAKRIGSEPSVRDIEKFFVDAIARVQDVIDAPNTGAIKVPSMEPL